MKTKIILTMALLLGLLKPFAQSYDEQYLQEEQSRLNQVQMIENEIQNFIIQNINSYDFTEIINKVNLIKDEDGKLLSGSHYQQTLKKAKEEKLRNVFFEQNPENLKTFYSTILKQQCVNGGFENATTSGFSFASNKFSSGYQAFNSNPTTVISASAGAKATIVDNSINDPTVGIPRVNSGKYAIRLNNNSWEQDYYHVTKMTRQFVVNENNISFAFALVLQNAGASHISSNTNPYYQVRLINNSNQVVFQRNVMATPTNPLFQQTGLGILYTNWLCERINTSAFVGQTVTLEIILGDCGVGGHWGYAYFDDFCGFECTLPSFNPSITLNAIKKEDCPSFPLSITGNITLPSNASLTNITLQILDLNNNIVNNKIITNAPAGIFSTILYDSDFYPNGYNPNTNFNIRAILNYTINGIPQPPIAVNNTNPPGPDVSFTNCPVPCFELIDVTQPTTSSQNLQAASAITSSSVIYPNLNVTYKAGDAIILTNGFYTTSARIGTFHAYIARCQQNNLVQKKQTKLIPDNNSLKDTVINIYPNPVSTVINIDSGNEKINSWELFDISGRSVLKGNSLQVNVQGLPKASYLLNINVNNKTTTKKVIVK